jgi:predicted nuclease of predicted toxin-antitoxin system
VSESLRFLADMNISPLTVAALQTAGWDIVRVSDVLPRTASDLAILAAARQTERVVITQDLDFSTLLALGGYDQPSLVTLRLAYTDPDLVTQRLLHVLPQIADALQQRNAVTVDERTVRIRKLPIT